MYNGQVNSVSLNRHTNLAAIDVIDKIAKNENRSGVQVCATLILEAEAARASAKKDSKEQDLQKQT